MDHFYDIYGAFVSCMKLGSFVRLTFVLHAQSLLFVFIYSCFVLLHNLSVHPSVSLTVSLFSLSLSHSPPRLLCYLKLKSSLVFLAASVGICPGAYVQCELMCLINTTLIICKLRVWVHITWEAYVARRVSWNKWLLNPASGVLASVDGPISLESSHNTQKEPHMLRQKRFTKACGLLSETCWG